MWLTYMVKTLQLTLLAKNVHFNYNETPGQRITCHLIASMNDRLI